MDWIHLIFNTQSYPARWQCGAWTPLWGWLHITADLFIFLAYMGIPAAILYFKKNIRHFKINALFILFASFIFFCGMTHLNEAIIFWIPFYNYAGVIKVITAAVSLTTLFTLINKMPDILQLINNNHHNKELQQIINGCPQGMIIINEKGMIQFYNTITCKLFGYTHEEILGKNIEKLIPNKLNKNHSILKFKILNKSTHTKMRLGKDTFAFTKSGQSFPVEVGLSPVSYNNEPCILCSVVDITERKNKEIQLEKLNTSLTLSNRELEEFTHVASHDLKEPLRGIHNICMMLIDDYYSKIDEVGQNRLAKLPKLTKRLESQINSLLEYSKVGQTTLIFEEVNLNLICDEVKESLSHLFHSKEIQFTVKTLPKVLGHEQSLNDVFTNLISNAIKYNRSEKPSVEIGWLNDGRRPEEKKYTLYIKDNGIGIESKHFNHIFTLFKRLHDKEEYGGGTGIGLTIVKKIIKRHGGKIWCESSPEHGSTFYFTLNRA